MIMMMPRALSEKSYTGTSLSVEDINLFRSFIYQAEQVAFYPSSGADIEPVLKQSCNTFFFADHSSIEKSRLYAKLRRNKIAIVERNEIFIYWKESNKDIYFFFIDNNEVLSIIDHFFGKIDLYIGFRDGCVEGGNYECVNRYPFLEKVVLSANPNGMDIYIDHSNFLDQYNQYIFGDRIIRFVGELPLKFNNDPIGPTRHYKVESHKPVRYLWESGLIKLTVEHDSILNHITTLDGIFCSPLCRKIAINKNFPSTKIETQPPYFFKPDLRLNWQAKDSLERLLDQAEKRGWYKIGVTAFGLGDHVEFMDVLGKRKPSKPTWLRIFHLEEGDFSGLKKKMSLENS
jgi:hypothetical protein